MMRPDRKGRTGGAEDPDPGHRRPRRQPSRGHGPLRAGRHRVPDRPERRARPGAAGCAGPPRAGGAAARGGTRRPARGGRRTPAGGPDRTEIRDWAKAQGIEVKDRGRVPAAVVARFKAATGQQGPGPGTYRSQRDMSPHACYLNYETTPQLRGPARGGGPGLAVRGGGGFAPPRRPVCAYFRLNGPWFLPTLPARRLRWRGDGGSGGYAKRVAVTGRTPSATSTSEM